MDETMLGTFDLATEAAHVPPSNDGSRRRAEILIKTNGLRVVLVTMLARATLQEHAAPGPITIHGLRGSFAVAVEDEHHSLPAGGLIGIASGVRHSVHAVEDGAFLLTIGGAGAPSPVN